MKNKEKYDARNSQVICEIGIFGATARRKQLLHISRKTIFGGKIIPDTYLHKTNNGLFFTDIEKIQVLQK